MKAAAIQFRMVEGKKVNLNKAYSMAKQAKEQGTVLVSFPEFFAHPWFVREEEKDHSFHDDTLEHSINLAKSLSLFVVTSYYEVTKDGESFNAVVIVSPKGEILGKYRKNHLPDLPGFRERTWYREGDLGFPVFQTDIGNIGLLICTDVMFPESIRILAYKEAEMIVIPRATLKKARYRWNRMLVANAIVGGAYVLSPNRSDTNNVEFDGHSMIIEPGGNIIQEAEEEDSILISKIDLDKVRTVKNSYPCNVKARFALYTKEYQNIVNS